MALAAWVAVGLMGALLLIQHGRRRADQARLEARVEEGVRERTAVLEARSSGDRASAEEASRSRQRFLDLVNSTDGIVWEADARTFVFSFVSDKAEPLLGYPLEDWLRPGFWPDHLHPADRVWAVEYCASCTGRLEPHRFEYRFLAADGRVIWLEDIVTVVSEDGQPSLLRGLMVDISDRKKAEAAVGDLAQRLTLATRAANIGIWEYEPASGTVVWDGLMHELFGMPADEFHGHIDDVRRWIEADDLPRLEEMVEASVKTGCDFTTTFRIRRGGSELRYIEAQALAIPAGAHGPARLIGVNRDVTDRIRNERELERLATTDPLTGCHNRSYLQRTLAGEIDRAVRYGDALSIVMFDLDEFKRVNDAFGHDAGDRVLTHCARLTRDAIRRTDVLARWGGEEFMVLCPHTDIGEAEALAERMLEALRAQPATGVGVVTASFGVVTLRPGEGIDGLLKRADALMYRAKEAGRSRVCCDPA